MPALDLIRQRLGFDPRELPGARLTVDLPVSEAFVNTQIAARLNDHPQIAAATVQAQPDDAVTIHVTPRMRFVPTLRISARIERQPEFPDHPVLALRWSMPAAGPLALFAAPVLAYFNAMPPGIRMEGDRITVDLPQLLRSQDADDLLPLVRGAEIHTTAGGFVARLEVAT